MCGFLCWQKDGCPLGLEETVTRELFESLIAGDLTRTRRPVNVALSDSGLHEGDLDMVLLAGGSTRIPAVRREIRGLLGIEPSAAIHPDYSIAEGAAVQAGIIGGAVETEKSLVMTDVNPYTLGVRTTDGYSSDVMSVIIPRNVTIPTTRRERYYTAWDDQDTVSVQVYQGNTRRQAETIWSANLKSVIYRWRRRERKRLIFLFPITRMGSCRFPRRWSVPERYRH